METFQTLLAKRLTGALLKSEFLDAGELTQATDPRFGDYQTNAALILGKQRGENSRAVAEKIPERFRVVGRIAVAVSTGDDEQFFFAGELAGWILRHIVHRRREPVLAGCITPYGYHYLLQTYHVFELGALLPQIGEMRPMSPSTELKQEVILLCLLAMSLLCSTRWKNR